VSERIFLILLPSFSSLQLPVFQLTMAAGSIFSCCTFFPQNKLAKFKISTFRQKGFLAEKSVTEFSVFFTENVVTDFWLLHLKSQ
jgi:hypothetical protein